MQINVNNVLNKTNLLNESYRKLITHSRTYASFTNKELDFIFSQLKEKKDIFDPMSGYGGLMQYAAQKGFSTYNVEINPPAYLWQVLTSPQHVDVFINAVEQILKTKSKWPTIKLRAQVSDDWFTDEAVSHLKKLFNYIAKIIPGHNTEFSLALLLPFVARFSNCVMGDVTHIKKGGICVYKDWENDFQAYLTSLIENQLSVIKKKSIEKKHEIDFGDCCEISLPKKKFDIMVSSPPYPNYRDYGKMFLPENIFLTKYIKFIKQPIKNRIIGSNIVKHKIAGIISSNSVKEFLHHLENFKSNKKAENAIKVYYLPYFANYFAEMENAIENISSFMSQNSEGYIVVVNNTTRHLIVPVKEAIIENWKNKGFNCEILDANEQFHFGTKNPHAKGLKAKHCKYIIKIWKK